jgi:hypothetical protein
MSKLALRAQTVDMAYHPLRQEFVGKSRFNDRSKGFVFGQQPVKNKQKKAVFMLSFPYIITLSLDDQNRLFGLPYDLLRHRTEKHFLKVGLPMGADDNSGNLLFFLNL